MVRGAWCVVRTKYCYWVGLADGGLVRTLTLALTLALTLTLTLTLTPTLTLTLTLQMVVLPAPERPVIHSVAPGQVGRGRARAG